MTYTIVLCPRCNGQSEQLILAVLELAVKGHWLCPFGSSRCGAVIGIEMNDLERMPSRRMPHAN